MLESNVDATTEPQRGGPELIRSVIRQLREVERALKQQQELIERLCGGSLTCDMHMNIL